MSSSRSMGSVGGGRKANCWRASCEDRRGCFPFELAEEEEAALEGPAMGWGGVGREEEEEAEVEKKELEVGFEGAVADGAGFRLMGDPGGEGVGESSMTIGSAAVAGGRGWEGETSRLGLLA